MIWQKTVALSFNFICFRVTQHWEAIRCQNIISEEMWALGEKNRKKKAFSGVGPL